MATSGTFAGNLVAKVLEGSGLIRATRRKEMGLAECERIINVSALPVSRA